MKQATSIPSLEIRNRSGETRTTELLHDRYIIGRSTRAQIHIDDPTVSRRHAEVYRDPFGRWWIRDLGSRYGTVVAGHRILERPLVGDEVVGLGDIRVRLRNLAAATVDDAAVHMPPVEVLDTNDPQLTTLPVGGVPKLASQQLSELIELGGKLGSVPDEEQRLRMLCEHVGQRLFRGSTVLALRVDTRDPDPRPREICRYTPERESPGQRPYVSQTLLREVAQTHAPALASNAPIGPVDTALSLSATHMKLAAVACPLNDHGVLLDVLYVTTPPHYGTSEWLALASFAAAQYQQAETSWRLMARVQAHEAIERDLARAREIQNGLLPRELDWRNADLAIGFEPCRWVGGDYLDVLPISDTRRLLVIGDVSGKGLPAAIVTGNIHATVHANLDDGLQLDRMVHKINSYLSRHLPDDTFVTLQCLLLDSETGAFECITAGHPRPLFIAPDGQVEEFGSVVHIPLGIEPTEFRANHGQLDDRWLMLYTDGVTDICNEQDARLEEEGLQEMIRALFDQTPPANSAELARALNTALDAYQGRSIPADDRTFILVRRAR